MWAAVNQADGFVCTRLLAPSYVRAVMTLYYGRRKRIRRFRTSSETYQALDEELAGLTADERFIGAFDDA